MLNAERVCRRFWPLNQNVSKATATNVITSTCVQSVFRVHAVEVDYSQSSGIIHVLRFNAIQGG